MMGWRSQRGMPARVSHCQQPWKRMCVVCGERRAKKEREIGEAHRGYRAFFVSHEMAARRHFLSHSFRSFIPFGQETRNQLCRGRVWSGTCRERRLLQTIQNTFAGAHWLFSVTRCCVFDLDTSFLHRQSIIDGYRLQESIIRYSLFVIRCSLQLSLHLMGLKQWPQLRPVRIVWFTELHVDLDHRCLSLDASFHLRRLGTILAAYINNGQIQEA